MSAGQPAPHKILVVDDDPSVRLLLQRMLAAEDYQVTLARDGQEALDIVSGLMPDLILLDLDMPRLSGLELCHLLKQNPVTRLIPILVLTGQDASSSRLQSWELGADEFLNKPFHNVEVLVRCRSLLRLKRLVDELDSAHAVVFAFARTVEAKCPYTLGHAERVTTCVAALAERLGLSEAERETLRRGAILHDIGKIYVPDALLNKPGPLTDEEFEVVKQHPLQGVRIVEPLRSIRDTVPIIRWHHERLDGQGYPDGLYGGAIPLLTRLLAVADVYDALASVRPYRPALPHDRCLELLRANSRGGGLDAELVESFCDLFPQPLRRPAWPA
jgi:putative two-component system response regulator